MAERIIANLTLDTYQRNKIPPLVIPQHDYGARYIRVRITEQGENVSVASGSVVSIIAKRMADGQSAAFSGSVNADGSVLVPVTQWMLDAPSDDVDCHVAVIGTGYQYSTTSFVISPQERENPSYLEEDDPRVNIVEEALIKVVEEADRAEEQANLAASNAKAEVERLVGELGVVQETGVSITSVMAQGASSRSFANAIKGEESGGAVLCEDVSPVLHPVVVGVRSRNLANIIEAANVTISNGIVTQIQADTGNNHFLTLQQYGDSGILSSTEESLSLGKINITFELVEGANVLIFGVAGSTNTLIRMNVREFTRGQYNFSCEFTNITQGSISWKDNQLIEGTTNQPYTPFVPDGTAVKVTSAGANLIQYPYRDTTNTVNGITFTDNGDGTVTANGTATADAKYWLVYEASMPAGSYILSGAPSVKDYGVMIVAHYANADGSPFYLNIYGGDEGKVLPIPTNTLIYLYIRVSSGTTVTNYVFKPMLNLGPIALPNEPYKAGQTIDTTVGSTIDLPSIAPYMSVYTDTEGTAVDVTYVKDTNAVVQKLVNAIVALGGNV